MFINGDNLGHDCMYIYYGYILSVQNIKNTCSFHGTDWPGEIYDPLLMSLVKSTSVHVDEGEETG